MKSLGITWSDNVLWFFRDSPRSNDKSPRVRQHKSSYLLSRNFNEFRCMSFNSGAVQQCGLQTHYWTRFTIELRISESSDRTSLRKRKAYISTHGEHDVLGNTRGDGAEGGWKKISARKREWREKSRRRWANAWRTLIVRVARVRTWLGAFSLVPSLRPSSSLSGESSPRGGVSSERKYAFGVWTGCGKKDAEHPTRIPPDPPTEPANPWHLPAMRRNTRCPHVPSTGSQQRGEVKVHWRSLQ